MKSIKTPGMTMESYSPMGDTFVGKMQGKGEFLNKDIYASCWKPTLKERLHILLGGNIMAVFTNGAGHPNNFFLKTSKQKEIK